MNTALIRCACVGLTLAGATLNVFGAAQNMIGRQSQNEGMLVLPAPAKVAIDGDLKEWDWSGRIWVFADSAVRSRYSVEAAAMWDKDHLYLAAKWKDPMPLFSLIDPAVNPNEGWKEDSWQMRIATADRTLWITTWCFTPQKQPVMHFAYWKNPRDLRGGEESVLLTAPPGGTDLGQGAAMAYQADADGKGFTQEIRIPWKLIYLAVPEIKPGVVFHMGNEFLWGDPTGKTWPVHRYADNMQPGKTSREFYWTATDAWGDLKLMDKGAVAVREYVSDVGRIDGTVPVRVKVPAAAARFTVVLDDEQGKRVRSLAADCDPADYAVKGRAAAGATREVEVSWDCLDDRGKLVTPGSYRVQGLTHDGLGAEYDMCFYNPGTPPWATQDGRGAWGADHSGPNGVAAAGDWTVVTFPVVEGGAGIIGIDPTGQKRWNDRRGPEQVTGDAQYVYAYVTNWYTKETICRFDAKTGAPKAFVRDGKERAFDLQLKEILGVAEPGKVTGMAVNGERLVLALSTDQVVVLDAKSAAVQKTLSVAKAGRLAFAADGTLYALIDGKVQRLDLATGAGTAVATPGVGQAVALAVDKAGNIVVGDAGPDCQAKAFSPDGKPAYSCGTKGGRPIRGVFEPQAISHLVDVAVDSQGRVWAVEGWNYPRRVSVWGQDGKLVRDYLGNTGYAGASCFLHNQDPTLAYCGPMEFKLDRTKNSWTLTRVLWVPDPAQGESFPIDTASNIMPERFTSSAAGKPHEYLYSHDCGADGGTGHVVYLERSGQYQPVAAITLAAHVSGKLSHYGAVVQEPAGEMAGLNAYDVVVWNDTNGDGKVQRAECEVVPAKTPGTDKRGGQTGIPLSNGWGGRIGSDLSIYTDGLARFKPLRYTADGAPVYGLAGRTEIGVKDNGDVVPVPGEDRIICLSWDGYAGPTKLTGVNTKTGTLDWYYPNPYPGVHGSHRATMPKPGLLIGPNKTLGIVHVSDEVGNVFALRGNLGQDFLMTTDGIFVGSMFQDGRLPGESLPDREAQLKGMPMEGFSEGGEPFNGWFGKQADGKVRLTTGMAREAGMVLEIKGLETIRRFQGGTIKVDLPTIVRADRENTARLAAAAEAKKTVVKRLDKPFVANGDAGKWGRIPPVAIAREGQPEKARVRLAYDDANLYVLFEVEDASPWRNVGKDLSRLFKTGDAVDLQLGLDAAVKRHAAPQAGDLRIVLAGFEGKPVAVVMAPVDKNAPAAARKSYTSPVGTKVFARVEALVTATVAVKAGAGRYVLEAAVPWSALGTTAPKPGTTLRGDFGFISSDAAGLINTARTYWANQATNLVNDEPLEAWLYPDTWGELTFE